MSTTRTPAQLAEADPSTRGFRLDPVCEVVAILKDLAQQRRPIDPRLLHCCLSLITAGSQLPLGASGSSSPSNPSSSARSPALADGLLGA